MTDSIRRNIPTVSIIITIVFGLSTIYFTMRNENIDREKRINDKLDQILIVGTKLGDHIGDDDKVHTKMQEDVQEVKADMKTLNDRVDAYISNRSMTHMASNDFHQ